MDISNIIVGNVLNTRLIKDFVPVDGNPRNSEGSFLRADDGSILYAYSRFTGNANGDHCPSDIALIRSYDEGETWSEPELIAVAKDLGVNNVMSVSGIRGLDNSIQFFFGIKEDGGKDLTEAENDIYMTIGRAVSNDGGKTFKASRCIINAPKDYYCPCNDRMVRMPDNSLAFPVCNRIGVLCVFSSDDDGESFHLLPPRVANPFPSSWSQGLCESVIHLHNNGNVTMYARSGHYFQFKTMSFDNMNNFTPIEPSEFSSASSPMQLSKAPDGTVYVVYNPIPGFNGKYRAKGCHGRTPLVLRRSLDDGLTWGELNIVEGDPERGYCYNAMFFTNDNSILMAHSRGGHGEDSCLAHMGIVKVNIDEIK